MKKEVWKDIPGYEGKYQASTLGKIRSLNYNNEKHCKILSPARNLKGYLQLNLRINGQVRCKKVHRLVAETFIQNLQNRPQVNHINGVKDDNRVENLEWCTNLENTQHSWIFLNRKSPIKGKFGRLHHNSIPVKMYNINGNFIREYESRTMAARELNLSSGHISEVVKNKRRQEGGYIWK